MGIVLRKFGASASIKITPINTGQPTAEYQSPFRESFVVKAKVEDDGPPTIAPLPAVSLTAKAKAVFKVLGGRAIKAVAHPAQDPQELNKLAGLSPPTDLSPEDESRLRWPPCAIGSRVVITNSLFAWVKHYKPGDECIVEAIPPNLSLAEDPYKYKSHLLRIVSPEGPRKGHTIILFRWEFEPVSENRVRIPSRLITQS